ncbi:MAG: uracil-DNA glycosylase [Acidimicrobiaceae bacterium]|nr:uracil-DNA glycosylase [Acidimicrobiaceae bacterium]
MDLGQIESCTRCSLSQTRLRVVAGCGPLDARLVVIGEAPGRVEDEGGAPFIGRSGQLLFRLIDEEIGLSRDQCFVTNVVKCRPPGNRTPKRVEISTCRPWLDEQMRRVSAHVVLVLGNTAARALLAHTRTMGEVHGRVFNLDEKKVVATYHPASALRAGPNLVQVMREDLRIVGELLERT